ncbi:MAG TPA: carboxypeptidase-like regulatory domain-containing protein [Symbiobacteriaceae bacterium]|jgi:hypothetical protein|nr:carboxypeptidase-like regulatory domain-containing protein [Symbiobacteriaceae bacterium]
MTQQLRSDFRMTRGLMAGRVRDRTSGLAVSGLAVVLGLRLGQPDELILVRTSTDAEGIFRFLAYAGFRPGAHQWGVLAGTRWRQATAGSPYSLIETVTLTTGVPVTRTVALQPVTRLGGRVVAADGTPAPGVALTAAIAGTDQPLAPGLTTDAGGLFSLSDRTADLFGFGTYDVGFPPSAQLTLALQPGGTGAPVEVTLRPGDSKSVTIPMS